MTQIKPGLRLRSAVSEVEVMIIKADVSATLTCGGTAMLAAGEQAPAGSSDTLGDFVCQLGKRYVNKAGSVELVCVKGGKGALAVDGEVLEIKAAKALPSSD